MNEVFARLLSELHFRNGAFFNWFSLAAIYFLFLFLWVQPHAGLCCIELESRSFVDNVIHFEVQKFAHVAIGFQG